MQDERPPTDGGGPEPPDVHDDLTVIGPEPAIPPRAAGPPDRTAASGRTIGSYRILSVIGRGGMGVVYEAEQQSPKRAVALKVVSGGHAVDEFYLRLFRREAQALARLKHPNIAAVYEAGRTDDGEHFVVMELVRGVDLETHVRRRQLSLRERLELFLQICDAINYAHQRGVIHRDLKPSNIIVDDQERVKILDFGLARIISSEIGKATLATEAGLIQGTLTHMSPEQARGETEEIDVRSDVYSLGVILFELLTDRLPHDVENGAVHDALRTICEKEPPRPGSLNRALRGDLETIILRAMAKEPDRRYAGVAVLAEDVRRFLTHQPIQARPASALYQMRKLILRHKTAATAAAALFLVVLTFGVWMRVLYKRAEAEAETANWAKEFMVGLFSLADPNVTRGDEVTARDLLDRGAEKIATDFDARPRIQAELMDSIVTAYRNLSLYENAEALARESLRVRREHLPEEQVAIARSHMALGWVLRRAGEYSQAEVHIRSALEINRRLLGEAHPVVAKNLHLLGTTRAAQGDYAEAQARIAEALAIRRRLPGGADTEIANSLVDLANATRKAGDVREAEVLVKEALQIHARLGDEQAPHAATAREQLASLKQARGDYRGAADEAREALKIRERVYDGSHPYVAASMTWLGAILRDAGDLSAAERYLRDALTRYRSNLGDDHEYVASASQHLAWVLLDRRATDEAEPLFARALEIYREQRLLERRPETIEPQLGLARIALARDDPGRAEELAREVWETLRPAYPEGHWRVASAEGVLGECLLVLGRYDEAERLLIRSHRNMEALRGEGDRYVREAARRINDLYEARGGPGPAGA